MMNDFWANGLQNRQKSRVKKLIIMIIFLLLVIALIILTIMYFNNITFRNWCDENIINKEITQDKVKTIVINKDENVQVYAYDKYICVLRKKTLEFYNGTCSKVGSINIDIVNADFISAGKYLAICEKNGQKFYLISGKDKIYENEIEGNISQINVSRSGYISVVISNTANYKSVVDIFDTTGKEVFKTNLVNSRVVDISVSQDNKYLAIAEVDISGIIIKSSVQIVSIDSAQITDRYDSDTGKLILNINYQENNKLICMYNDSIGILKGMEYSELVKYESSKLAFVNINLNNRIVYVEESSSGEYTSNTCINIFSSNTNRSKQYIAPNVAKAIIASENKIAINFGTELHIIDIGGILVKKYKSDAEINDVVITDSLAAIVYNDNIAIINF